MYYYIFDKYKLVKNIKIISNYFEIKMLYNCNNILKPLRLYIYIYIYGDFLL